MKLTGKKELGMKENLKDGNDFLFYLYFYNYYNKKQVNEK